MTRILRLALLVAAPLLTPVLRAQIISAYVTSANTHLSNVQTGSVYSGAAGYQNQFTSYWTSGIGGGVTLGILPIGPVRLGFDVRGSTKPGTTGADTAFAGLKLGLKAPLIPIKPYVQVSGGYVATRTVNVSTSSIGGNAVGGTFTNQYAAYEVLGGVDFKLIPFVDLRAVEVGFGKGYNVGGLTASGTSSMTLFTINTGLVVHF